MKINTTVLDFDIVCATLSHALTWDICKDLKEAREELINLQNSPVDEDADMEDYLGIYMKIQEQLVFLNNNIRTLETALLRHEARVSEKRLSLGGHMTFWLN